MHADDPQQRTWWKTPYGIALLVFLCVAAFFLTTEHWAHVIPYLPFLLFLLCPLMHFFMHGNHEKSHHHDEDTAHGPPSKNGEHRHDSRDVTHTQ
jgi:Protein of unknown function (DUF2933)